MQLLTLRIELAPLFQSRGCLVHILAHRPLIGMLLAHLLRSMLPTSRETLVSLSAARIRAHRATSSSRVIVTFFIARFSCITRFVSTITPRFLPGNA
jgi:hypothetical protein